MVVHKGALEHANTNKVKVKREGKAVLREAGKKPKRKRGR